MFLLLLTDLVTNWQYLIHCCVQAHKAHTNQGTGTRLKVAAGLAEMENRKYKNAARYFLQASFDHCQCPDVCYYFALSLSVMFYHSRTASLYLHCGCLWRSVCSCLFRSSRATQQSHQQQVSFCILEEWNFSLTEDTCYTVVCLLTNIHNIF